MCYTNAISWQICTILVRLSEVVQIRHLVKYVQIAEFGLDILPELDKHQK